MATAHAAKIETVPALIGGERSFAAGGATIDAVNPATGAMIARFPRCGPEDVDRAVSAAREAFPAWKALNPAARAAMLNQLAGAVVSRGEELARLDAEDNGSPLGDLRRDALIGAAELRYYAGLALQVKGETIPTGNDRVNYTIREPFGVVGRIILFNHPLLFATMKIGAPLAAGNTVVLKPSEHTSLSALRLAEEFQRIFPPGVLSVLTGYGPEAGDALVVHPDVRRLAFIGQAETGRAIQARAASVAVKSVSLELGGKNPIVVFPDADIEKAVAGVVNGMNFNFQSQSCGSTSRLLVHRDIHERFVEAVVERISALRVGMPEEADTEIGTLINTQQFEKVQRYIELGRAEGAQLLTGGSAPEGESLSHGFFIRPAVFDGVDPGMRLAQEEIFGPVLAILKFDTYEEAISIANDTRFGLTASVFTRDLKTAHAFARDVQAGFVWVNDSNRHFLGTPFGGFKDSGLGRDEDIDELLSYTQVKNVNVLFE